MQLSPNHRFVLWSWTLDRISTRVLESWSKDSAIMTTLYLSSLSLFPKQPNQYKRYQHNEHKIHRSVCFPDTIVNSFGVWNYIIVMWWVKSALSPFPNGNKKNGAKVQVCLFQIKNESYVLHFLLWVSFCWFSAFWWPENANSRNRSFS